MDNSKRSSQVFIVYNCICSLLQIGESTLENYDRIQQGYDISLQKLNRVETYLATLKDANEYFKNDTSIGIHDELNRLCNTLNLFLSMSRYSIEHSKNNIVTLDKYSFLIGFFEKIRNFYIFFRTNVDKSYY